jgi:hypothetical protein
MECAIALLESAFASLGGRMKIAPVGLVLVIAMAMVHALTESASAILDGRVKCVKARRASRDVSLELAVTESACAMTATVVLLAVIGCAQTIAVATVPVISSLGPVHVNLGIPPTVAGNVNVSLVVRAVRVAMVPAFVILGILVSPATSRTARIDVL